MSGQQTRLPDDSLGVASFWGQSEMEDLSTDPSKTGKGGGKDEEEVFKLAQKETRNVRMWRRNVFFMLFGTAALVTSLTYIFLRDEDEEDFTTSVCCCGLLLLLLKRFSFPS
jgi:hypothetical protein